MKRPIYGGAHYDANQIAKRFNVKLQKDQWNGTPQYSVKVPDWPGGQADAIGILKSLEYTVGRWDRMIESDGYTEIEMSSSRKNGCRWVSGFVLRFSDKPYWYFSFSDCDHEPSVQLSFEYELRGLDVEDCMVEVKHEPA